MNINLQELSGMDDDRIYLFVDRIEVIYQNRKNAFEDFVSKIYKKWKI